MLIYKDPVLLVQPNVSDAVRVDTWMLVFGKHAFVSENAMEVPNGISSFDAKVSLKDGIPFFALQAAKITTRIIYANPFFKFFISVK